MRKTKEKSKKMNFEIIWKNEYFFDINRELRIYRYLCCKRIKKRKLENEYRFSTYKDWEEYVKSKYQDFNKEQLTNFSKYLNQNIREIGPDFEYWKLMATIFCTIIITKFFEYFIQFFSNLENLNSFFSSSSALQNFVFIFILILMFLLFLVVPFFFIIYQIVMPLIEYNTKNYFYQDYKTIIDEIIDTK